MKYLSIRQPWAHLILNSQSYTVTRTRQTAGLFIPDESEEQSHKDVENRSWKTEYRGPLLIHASKKIEKMDAVHVHNAHRGTRLAGGYPTEPLQTGGIIGVAWLAGCADHSISSPWFDGEGYGWLLWHAEPLPFTPLKGGLGLRDLSAKDLLPETLEAYEAWREKIRAVRGGV